MNRCAFSGHRPKSYPWKYNETAPGCILLKEVLTEQIMALANKGVTDWFSGMALGADLWCAQIVLSLQKTNPALRFHCVLPCEGQADSWSGLAQEQYHLILRQAVSVDYVSHAYHVGCMIDRNHRLVDSTDLLLAVYNGARRSGTGATVNYAQKMDRKIIVIDPITRQITYRGIVPPPV